MDLQWDLAYNIVSVGQCISLTHSRDGVHHCFSVQASYYNKRPRIIWSCRRGNTGHLGIDISSIEIGTLKIPEIVAHIVGYGMCEQRGTSRLLLLVIYYGTCLR